MKRILVLCATVAFLMASPSSGAWAADGSDSSDAKPERKGAEIVVDEDAGAVRILINGEEVVLIDADGLHVRGDLAYSGVIKDTGSSP